MRWLRLSRSLQVKVYHGYGHTKSMVVYGHVISLGPSPRKKYTNRLWINLFALIRLFIVRPVKYVNVRLKWEGKVIQSRTDKAGFFKLEWSAGTKVAFGWHKIKVEMTDDKGNVLSTGAGSIFIPHSTQFGFISDIDDTFLISHSSDLWKRLYVLFTKNALSRMPFEGVVEHYRLLAHAHTPKEEPNPFFYVSSSEWNLYDYILKFTVVRELPPGVFLLSPLKRFSELLKTGQNRHSGKFMRISRILKAFPKQKFILLGDSSQQDPYIYASIIDHFPGRIHAVYIRDVHHKNQSKVEEVLLNLESKGVTCCFFRHSYEAIIHSRNIGLIE
ncbi:Phosphatidate phosphatase APP1 [Pseudarcicella hirudinis]|uniref:Phosphatidate phosphatase APP1 n=2 Tax=Pseudarcicella hirudinis TaxID=1079859 RepID=A0A1I5LY01_9BACT|nr:Phosphatidate phosphatase APP1 [Pseudarcicella hirudinis]